MTRTVGLLLVFWLALLLAACTKVKPPIIKPHSAEVTGVSPAGLGLRLHLDVTNPNRGPLIVRSVSGRVTLADRIELGDATADSCVSILGRETKRVLADVKVPWKNLSELASLASSGEPVAYRFAGKATVGGERLNVQVPFQLTGSITAAELLQATLRSLPTLPGHQP